MAYISRRSILACLFAPLAAIPFLNRRQRLTTGVKPVAVATNTDIPNDGVRTTGQMTVRHPDGATTFYDLQKDADGVFRPVQRFHMTAKDMNRWHPLSEVRRSLGC